MICENVGNENFSAREQFYWNTDIFIPFYIIYG